jgi:hypothetical protein
MTRVILATLIAVTLLTGCSERFGFMRKNGAVTTSQPVPRNAPTTEQLVAYLNDNASRINGLSCTSVDLTCNQGGQSVGLRGKLMAQKNRNFRMNASSLGKTVVDLGSNEREFWYWVSEVRPAYQFYCSYDDMAEGRVKHMPLPVQPDWVMETLGFGPYGPADRYELKVEAETLQLIERTKGPKGNAIRKVIVMNRRPVQAPEPQVLAHMLIDDATGQEICSARITEVQVCRQTHAVIPRKTELRCPSEKLSLAMKLDGLAVNPQLPESAFVRQPLRGVQSFNLAMGRTDAPVSIQQVGGFR